MTSKAIYLVSMCLVFALAICLSFVFISADEPDHFVVYVDSSFTDDANLRQYSTMDAAMTALLRHFENSTVPVDNCSAEVVISSDCRTGDIGSEQDILSDKPAIKNHEGVTIAEVKVRSDVENTVRTISSALTEKQNVYILNNYVFEDVRITTQTATPTSRTIFPIPLSRDTFTVQRTRHIFAETLRTQ